MTRTEQIYPFSHSKNRGVLSTLPIELPWIQLVYSSTWVLRPTRRKLGNNLGYSSICQVRGRGTNGCVNTNTHWEEREMKIPSILLLNDPLVSLHSLLSTSLIEWPYSIWSCKSIFEFHRLRPHWNIRLVSLTYHGYLKKSRQDSLNSHNVLRSRGSNESEELRWKERERKGRGGRGGIGNYGWIGIMLENRHKECNLHR